ncbi:hypothetical protein ACSBR2_003361 [Camellia fascicularis]
MDCFSYFVGQPNNKEKKKKRSRKVVKLSTDPQSVAARERRHRISDKFKTLQSLVPGGAKMDTVSMLEEAIHYVKFLKTQIWLHQTMINFMDDHDHDTSALIPPNSDGVDQWSLCLPENLVGSGEVVAPPDSCFQGGETKGFVGTMNY